MDEKYAISEVIKEYNFAKEKFCNFASTHEGYAVLLEEVDELWDEIKKNGSKDRLTKEAIQVAAMSIRFLIDCC